ncbi:MAG: putative inorganic carbon transporter subunit DabA [Planctomycetaceae bacterium]
MPHSGRGRGAEIAKFIATVAAALPGNGSLRYFRHHHPLHGLQNLPFTDAVRQAACWYRAESWLTEQRYAQMLTDGKIELIDVYEFLERDLGAMAGCDVAGLATRLQLRFAMIQFGLASATGTSSQRSRTSDADTTADRRVESVLVPFLSGFLDQGQLQWRHTDRDSGLLKCFAELYGRSSLAGPAWLRTLPAELLRLSDNHGDALQSIDDSLFQHGGSDTEQFEYLRERLFSLAGWAGMIHYLEARAEWMAWSVPSGTLHEFIALRLILDRLATTIPNAMTPSVESADVDDTDDVIASLLVRLPGLSPDVLSELTSSQWCELRAEVLSFSDVERRRCLQAALETRRRRQFLDAVSIHAASNVPEPSVRLQSAMLQVVCCTDTCSESLRRHLEEAGSKCQTFGTPGFFGVAMNFRALGESQFVPHCPPNVRPGHYVQAVPGFHPDGTPEHNPRARKQVPRPSPFRTVELSSLLENWLSRPWMTKLLFPRIARQVRGPSSGHREAALNEQLDCEGVSLHNRLPGYSVEEMTDAVQQFLTGIGLTDGFAPIVLLVGHVSISTGNAFAAADSCAFCAGRSSAPNARTLALMANDHRVRTELARDGFVIPHATVFVAAEHETCGDTIEYFDLSRLTLIQKTHLPAAMDLMDEALCRNAHERCRRFHNVPLEISCEDAAVLVEDRGAQLTEMIPEFSQCGNAVCLIGRRKRSRGLFLDRRAFLASYDPTTDDDEGTQLIQVLKQVLPTCVSVNLQYYFSSLDPERFGAGSKLSHSVTSGMAVTCRSDGDLRTGLPEEMVRHHDPCRLTVLIETTPQIMREVLNHYPTLRQWCESEWLFLATLDPNSHAVHHWQNGNFEHYDSGRKELPEVSSSAAWYRGLRDDLSFARIAAAVPPFD